MKSILKPPSKGAGGDYFSRILLRALLAHVYSSGLIFQLPFLSQPLNLLDI